MKVALLKENKSTNDNSNGLCLTSRELAVGNSPDFALPKDEKDFTRLDRFAYGKVYVTRCPLPYRKSKQV